MHFWFGEYITHGDHGIVTDRAGGSDVWGRNENSKE